MDDPRQDLIDAIGYGNRLDIENTNLRDRAANLHEEWATLDLEVRGRIDELAPDLVDAIMGTQP